MERLARFARYFRRTRNDDDDDDATATSAPSVKPDVVASSFLADAVQNVPETARPPPPSSRPSHEAANYGGDDDTAQLVCNLVEDLPIWADVLNSVLVFLAFNVMFWIVFMLDLGSFAMVCGTAVLMLFWCWTTVSPETQEKAETREMERAIFYSRVGRLKQISGKIVHNLGWLRNEQPGLFCILACAVSTGVWLLGHVVSGVALAYMTLTCVLLGPTLLLRVPDRISYGNQRESDSEIEEFLPAATETNIQVLEQAGEAGEYRLELIPICVFAPNGTTNEEQEFLNDGDLAGHKMPSHEDGSSDGLELSDLELSDKRSTSSSSSNQSDSEFEIIDQQEIRKIYTLQDST